MHVNFFEVLIGQRSSLRRKCRSSDYSD